jgi:hypothetical protein
MMRSWIPVVVVAVALQASGARAEPEAPRLLAEIVDPWQRENSQRPAPSALADPWRSRAAARAAVRREIVDPWQESDRRVPTASFELVEIVDPWAGAAPRSIPTARFPPIE